MRLPLTVYLPTLSSAQLSYVRSRYILLQAREKRAPVTYDCSPALSPPLPALPGPLTKASGTTGYEQALLWPRGRQGRWLATSSVVSGSVNGDACSGEKVRKAGRNVWAVSIIYSEEGRAAWVGQLDSLAARHCLRRNQTRFSAVVRYFDSIPDTK